jgi:hypothetical protein
VDEFNVCPRLTMEIMCKNSMQMGTEPYSRGCDGFSVYLLFSSSYDIRRVMIHDA